MNAVALFLIALPIAAAIPIVVRLDVARSPASVVGLAIGFGFGATSFGCFLAVVAGSNAVMIAFDAAFLLAGSLAAVRLRRVPVGKRPWHPVHVAGLVVFGIAAATASIVFAANTAVHPHGEWDAWAIWNLRARFLASVGGDWRNGLADALSWSHPDYPLLLPASVARVWRYIGATPTSVPASIAFLFAVALVALLFGALNELRGRVAALLATIGLLGTPAFLQQAPLQYADVPLAFYFVATLALLASADRDPRRLWLSVAAGATAGFAAWTKNEGLLFVVVVFAVRAIDAWRGGDDRRGSFARFIVGILPSAVVLISFKLWVAPPGDRFTAPASEMWLRLTDASRYLEVARSAGRHAFRFAPWVGGALIAYVVLVGRAPVDERRAGYDAGRAVLLMLVGYGLVYVLTASVLNWQLGHSLTRLLLQLWPSFLFAFFAAAGSLDDRVASPR